MAEKIQAHVESAEEAQVKAVAETAEKATTGAAKSAATSADDEKAMNEAAEQVAKALTEDGSAGETASAAASVGILALIASWMQETFPKHKNTIAGGACGLLLALLLFWIGLFKTVVIAALVVIGVAAGQYLDGDPKIARAAKNLMNKK